MQGRGTTDLIVWFFLGLFLLSILLIGWLLLPFLSTIVLAAVVSGFFNPIYHYLASRFQISASIAALLTCFLVFTVLFIPILFLTFMLSKEAYDLYVMGKAAVLDGQVKTFLETHQVIERINHLLTNVNLRITIEELNRSLSDLGKAVGLLLFDQARLITSNIFNFVAHFFFMLLIVYFFLMDNRRLVAFIVDLSPLPDDQDRKLIQKFKDMAGAILIGNGLGGIIQGTIGGVVFAIFGLNAPFLWGILMALLAFLPIVGIGIVLIPTAVILIIKDRVFAGVFFLVFYLVLSFGIEYIFKPKVVGNRVKMHTLLVFLAIIGGMKSFGILGIIYGPLIVTCFLTLVDIYQENYRNLFEPASNLSGM